MFKIKHVTSILFTASMSLSASASTISSYQDFVEAIENGLSFNIVTNFNQCTIKSAPFSKENAGLPTGYFAPTDFMVIPSGSNLPQQISTSDLHFTNQSGVPTYEYVKYVFTPDNLVSIETTNYAPQTFIPNSPLTFICHLNNGVNVISK